MAFSCGARSAFKLKENDYLRSMLSRRQLQGFVRHRLKGKRQLDLLLVIFQSMPSAIIAFRKNKTITFTTLHKAAAFNMGRANNARFEVGGFNVLLKHLPDFINLFTEGYLVFNRNIGFVIHNKRGPTIWKIHFTYAGNFDLFTGRQFERL